MCLDSTTDYMILQHTTGMPKRMSRVTAAAEVIDARQGIKGHVSVLFQLSIISIYKPKVSPLQSSNLKLLSVTCTCVAFVAFRDRKLICTCHCPFLIDFISKNIIKIVFEC